ncbi:major facilitator superfamily domain-containing protein [Pyronema domesticum]|nr:major facilitator superfamily domain-containing protein [Pyronema domesticum]
MSSSQAQHTGGRGIIVGVGPVGIPDTAQTVRKSVDIADLYDQSAGLAGTDLEMQTLHHSNSVNDIKEDYMKDDEGHLAAYLSEGDKQKDVERSSAESPTPPQPAVVFDGGEGWIQVAWCYPCMFATWGIINTYGTFQAYYMAQNIASPQQAAWIGSLQTFLMLVVSPLVGRLFDAGKAVPLIRGGTALLTLGLISASFTMNYYVLLFTQGIIAGLGLGLIFTPSVTIVTTYFQRRRALALGIATTGGGVGGVIYPILVRTTMNAYGFAWSMRTMGFMVLAIMVLPCIFSKQRTDLRKRKLKNGEGEVKFWGFLKERQFMMCLAGIMAIFGGMYTPYFFITSWVAKEGINLGFQGWWLLSLVNAGSILGRIGPAICADLMKSPLLVQLISVTLCGILCLCWIPIHTAPLTIFFALTYGVASGAFLGLMPAGTAALTTDMRYVGVRTGIVFSVAGISNLIGNPVAGKIVGSYGYTAAKVWAGCCMMVGSAILVWMVLGKKKAQPQKV